MLAVLALMCLSASGQSNAVLDALQMLTSPKPPDCATSTSREEEGGVTRYARITPGAPIRGEIHHKWWSDCLVATIAGARAMQRPLFQHIDALVNEDHGRGKPVLETELNGALLPLSVDRMASGQVITHTTHIHRKFVHSGFSCLFRFIP